MKKPVTYLAKGEAEQTFSIHAPGARSVHLAADFTEWQQRAIPMKPVSDGLLSTAVMLPAGTYQYRFLVDGEWRMVRAPNSYGHTEYGAGNARGGAWVRGQWTEAGSVRAPS